MAEWFIVRDGKEQGPLSTRQLMEMALKEEIVWDDLIRRSDKQSPTVADNIEGLIPEWLILHLSDQMGPYTSQDLVTMVLKGDVSRGDLLRRFDWLEWRTADSIRGMSSLFELQTTLLNELGAVSVELKADPSHELEPDFLWFRFAEYAGEYYPTSEIKELIRTGKLLPDDLIAYEWDWSPWRCVRDVPFFDEEKFLATFPSYKRMQELMEGGVWAQLF